MKRFIAICAAVFAALTLQAQLQQSSSIKTVHGKGRNADYRTAVYEALVQAMSQVQGVSLNDSRDAFMDSLKQSKSTSAGESNLDEVRESLKQSVSATTKGRVLSYEITSEKFDGEMGLWCIELDAKVPGQYTVGLPADNRRRLIVMPFRALTADANVYGTLAKLDPYCESIAGALNEYLVQTRRFTMLDREFNAETETELSRLNYENASAGDFGRFQQLLVTDYMVIGTVKMYSSPAAAYNQWTGSTTAADGPFLEVSYRVILVPTSQLKWAGTVTIPYSACPGATAQAAISSAIDYAASEVCHEIIDNIYPVRVTDKTTFELVLNQGGVNIREGDVYDVFRRGEAIRDVSSQEYLGAPEEKIARIRITRVDPKMSYAVVVEGTPIEGVPVGAVVRRPRAVPGACASPGVVSPVKVAPDGAVSAPWAK